MRKFLIELTDDEWSGLLDLADRGADICDCFDHPAMVKTKEQLAKARAAVKS